MQLCKNHKEHILHWSMEVIAVVQTKVMKRKQINNRVIRDT